MRTEDFEFLSGLVKRESGIVLTEQKAYLFESRLAPVAKSLGMASVAELVGKLRRAPDRDRVRTVVDAMTTNESLFFRDNRPFETLRQKVLPDLVEARQATKRLRIWSAACSSGQEPYSIAMVIDELGLVRKGWQIEIVATDISDEMLARAAKGRFSKMEVMRGLPVQMLVRHFEEVDDEWQIHDALRRQIRFQRFNLLEPASRLGSFDIVFCRNVLIYFDKETKEQVLKSIADRLSPDGALFLGSAETLLGLDTPFVSSARYQGVQQHSAHASQAAAAA